MARTSRGKRGRTSSSGGRWFLISAAALAQKRLGVLERLRVHGNPAQHARDLAWALLLGERVDPRVGAAFLRLLLHVELAIGERRDLRQVGDADDLAGFGHALELAPHDERGLAAHARVDLVKEV